MNNIETNKNKFVSLRIQSNWIRNIIDDILTDRLNDNTRNNIRRIISNHKCEEIKNNIEISALSIIKHSKNNSKNNISIRLTPFNTKYNLCIKLMYVPHLINMIKNEEKKKYASSGLSWGIVGYDLIKNYGCLPILKNSEGKKIKPYYRSDYEIWYPFHEYKFIFSRITFEISLLYEFIKGDSFMNSRVIESKSFTSGLLGIDIAPDLSFIRKYDDKFHTSLIDLIKCDPKKGLKPYKTSIETADGVNTIYRFNQNGTQPKLIIDALALVSRHIPLLFNKSIRWSVKQPYKKTCSIVKRNLRKFWESKCIVALLSFCRHTRLLVKSSDYGKMYVVDPWKKFDNYEQNSYYNNILRVANQMGIQFVFLERYIRDQVKGEGSCSLASFARAIYVCMSLMIEYEEVLIKNSDEFLIDEFDENKLMNFLHDPFNDSVALLATSVMKKSKSVCFNPVVEYWTYDTIDDEPIR